MGLNSTPSANRIHIGFFGARNAGKSSLLNAVTGQELAVVSDIKGTTTDPVYKAMELLPLGPVVLIDTPGLDDEGSLGAIRVQKARQVLRKADLAVLVVDATVGQTEADQTLLREIQDQDIPHLVVYNKADIATGIPVETLAVSAQTGQGVQQLKCALGDLLKPGHSRRLVADLLQPSDVVVLVTPIDESAPKGRLILPQQQVIREVLDAHAVCTVTQETELRPTLERLGKRPAMVITDSQVFAKVAADTPSDIPLTSFSILMARYKGFLETAVKGIRAVESLQEGDRVLLAEGCTHHRQCKDIGTVKIPRWLSQYTHKQLQMETVSGAEFPDDLSGIALVIHCGGCMLNEREIHYRMQHAIQSGVAFTNYGTIIAYMQGILRRSLELFPALLSELDELEGR